jgi:uncharacterized protein (DUF1501 family)
LRWTAGLGLSGAAAAMLEQLCLTSAWATTPPTDYKALVCVFLAGGNDGNQTVVPLSGAAGHDSADVTGGYTAYFNERNGQGLAIAATSLVSIGTPTVPAGTTALGEFAFNPNLATTFNATQSGVTIPIPSLAALYNSGAAGGSIKVAVVCNVGALGQPLSKAQYQSSPALRPNQLFSHSDQVRENQTCVFTVVPPAGVGGSGWGGRTADRTALLNGAATFPMETSISGAPQFMSGNPSFPLAISPAPAGLNTVLVLNGFGTAADEVARKTAFNNLLGINVGANKLVDAASAITNEALSVSSALSVDPQLLVPNPGGGAPIALTFPNTTLGNQLKQVAKVIKANLQQPALGLKRQIFFCQVGGFDTHQNENGTQPGLLSQLNQALGTFYYWLQNNTPGTGEPTLGDLSATVTSFTLSDFNRTFNPAGSGGIVGTDHAWGNHWFVVGGAVNSGFFGVPLPGGNGSVFPTLGKGAGNAYDVDNAGGRGRWIPSVSTLQYANTLAAWYGLDQTTPATLDYVFPLLRTNFAQTTLGFV